MRKKQRNKMLARLEGVEERLLFRRRAREQFNSTYYAAHYAKLRAVDKRLVNERQDAHDPVRPELRNAKYRKLW